MFEQNQKQQRWLFLRKLLFCTFKLFFKRGPESKCTGIFSSNMGKLKIPKRQHISYGYFLIVTQSDVNNSNMMFFSSMSSSDWSPLAFLPFPTHGWMEAEVDTLQLDTLWGSTVYLGQVFRHSAHARLAKNVNWEAAAEHQESFHVSLSPWKVKGTFETVHVHWTRLHRGKNTPFKKVYHMEFTILLGSVVSITKISSTSSFTGRWESI